MKAKLKICGMKEPANIAEVIALQPDYMGFLMYANSKRFIDKLDPEVIKAIPSAIKTTGVFVDEELETVEKAIECYQFKAVQLHGNESPEYCATLKGKAEIIKAFGIDSHFNFGKLESYVAVVDYFLFDTQTPAHGGSGKTFNWELLQGYTLPKPYFLSGGIGLEQVPDLLKIKDERFYTVDINSRFELAPGLKDAAQLLQFKKILGCP